MTVNTQNPHPPGRRPGKRLSPWRVSLGVGVVLAVLLALVGVPWYLALNAPTSEVNAGPRWFGGYLDVTAAHASDAVAVGDGSDDTVVLAFIVAAGPRDCEPTWGAAYSLSEAARELDLERRIDTMRRDGAHVVVSFGGAINTELGAACATVAEAKAAYAAVLDRYHLATIDLDLEGPNLADAAAGARRAAAIAQLQQEREDAGGRLDVWVTLPTALEGLTEEGLRAVEQLLSAGVTLTGVNVMTMNYGVDLEGRSMGEASIRALEAVHDQLRDVYRHLRIALPPRGAWAIMGATPMIGQNDIVAEIFHLADAQHLSQFAQQRGLARISMWSLNRDRACGPNYPDVSIVSDACSGVRQERSAFAAILSPGFFEAPTDVATPEPVFTPIPDDPATAPYPIWSPTRAYSSGVRVVWHGYVYQAKWWVLGAPEPDDPTQSADQTSWVLVGAVTADDTPFALPNVPVGTYPEWDRSQVYEAGARVVVDDVPFYAKWWTQGDDPIEGITDHDRSPWAVLENPTD